MRGVQRPWTWLAIVCLPGALLLRGTASWWSAAMPSCMVRDLTGLHCPGCGGTRCATRLLEGDLAGALSMNPAVVLIAASALGIVATSVWQESRGRAATGVPPWLLWTVAIFVLFFSLVRNLPWWPFTLLAPH
ncbi:DUF2752 domain-containing protein [Luteolibacter flavescens]|uniref:DUF2752 domain-containing protein n=1 Tax=Luteolibacter flavescens TaxID=1859460 RepID=A0ABT3FJH0_9BACT|nr:DUF2752 domain-containing protein [Luteolibacter flavescens]MCW1883719.1 DUF2752 domain-containing protein [Luteolibacter flavescens]